MTSLSFYEQTGIVIPGSVLLFGLTLLVPDLRALFASDGMSVGGLGLFLVIAYATGHLVAAVGNAVEWCVWKLRGGMPTDWITHDNPKIINTDQVAQIENRVRQRLGLQVGNIKGMARRSWAPIFGQIYRDVLRHNPGRIETFNGNYGLNRGLAAALLCLSISVLLLRRDYQLAATLAAGCLVFLYRMHRFGVHFGREVYFRFLGLPQSPPSDSAK